MSALVTPSWQAFFTNLSYWLLLSQIAQEELFGEIEMKKISQIAWVVLAVISVAVFTYLLGWFWGLMVGLMITALVLGAHFYLIPLIPYWLAQYNMFWTMGEEGTSKQVMNRRKFVRSLLVKRGHKYDTNWNVVPLEPGDQELESGLLWVGIWPFFQIYTRTMRFVKALADDSHEKKYERREDPGTDFLLTGTDYQYALLFKDAEDRDKLNLSGQMTMTAKIINPYKALFLVKDWFDALVMRVLPRVREYISEHTYDELINNPNFRLDADVFRMLGEPDPSGGPSTLSILEGQYGIKLVALETVNIDPPPDYREVTLRQFKAVQNAKAEAEETGGALDLMVAKELDSLARRKGFVHKNGNHKGEVDQKKLLEHLEANSDVLLKIQERQLHLLQQGRGGKLGRLRRVEVGNADGSNLEPVTATLVALIDLLKSSQDVDPNNPGSPSQSAKDRIAEARKRLGSS